MGSLGRALHDAWWRLRCRGAVEDVARLEETGEDGVAGRAGRGLGGLSWVGAAGRPGRAGPGRAVEGGGDVQVRWERRDVSEKLQTFRSKERVRKEFVAKKERV